MKTIFLTLLMYYYYYCIILQFKLIYKLFIHSNFWWYCFDWDFPSLYSSIFYSINILCSPYN